MLFLSAAGVAALAGVVAVVRAARSGSSRALRWSLAIAVAASLAADAIIAVSGSV